MCCEALFVLFGSCFARVRIKAGVLQDVASVISNRIGVQIESEFPDILPIKDSIIKYVMEPAAAKVRQQRLAQAIVVSSVHMCNNCSMYVIACLWSLLLEVACSTWQLALGKLELFVWRRKRRRLPLSRPCGGR